MCQELSAPFSAGMCEKGRTWLSSRVCFLTHSPVERDDWVLKVERCRLRPGPLRCDSRLGPSFPLFAVGQVTC